MAWSDEVIILYSWRQRGQPGTYWEWSGHQIPGLKNTHNVKTWALPTSSHVKIQHQLRATQKTRGKKVSWVVMVQVSALKLFIILRRQVHTLSQCPSFIFVSCFTKARGMIWAVTVLCHDRTFYHCLKLLCLNTDQ